MIGEEGAETKTRICIATTAQPFCESSVAVKKREAHDLEIVCGRTEGEKIKRLLKFRNLVRPPSLQPLSPGMSVD